MLECGCSRVGGNVLTIVLAQFAGDALICMFGDDRKLEDPKKLCLRATQSAMYIQTALDKYDSGEGFVLTLHVGIGYGDMYSLYVGGVDGGWVRPGEHSVACTAVL